jgi:gas vesicle protein
MSQNKSSHNVACFLLGLGVGAVAALVLAPQSGEETRRLIAGTAKNGRDYLEGAGKKVRGQTGEYIAKGSDLLTQGKQRLAEAIQAGKQTYRATLGR